MPTPPRLPEVGHDEDNWGTILNEYLQVSHNDDGTEKLSKALGSDITIGTDDTKYVTSKAINDAGLGSAINERLLGSATTTTTPSGSAITGDYYEALTTGTYTNFGGITATIGSKIKKTVGGTWFAETTVNQTSLNAALASKADLVVGKNVFNKAAATIGYLMNYNTGVPALNATYDYSDFIPVVAGQQYKTSNSVRYTTYYNANKTVVTGGSSAAINLFTIPANVYFIIVTLYHTFYDTLQMELGSVATAYEPYIKAVKKTQIDTKGILDDLKVVNGVVSNQQFDGLFTQDKSLSTLGALSISIGSRTTDFQPILNPLVPISISGLTGGFTHRICFYSAIDVAILPIITFNNGELLDIMPPVGSIYYRIFYKNRLETDDNSIANFMVSLGGNVRFKDNYKTGIVTIKDAEIKSYNSGEPFLSEIPKANNDRYTSSFETVNLAASISKYENTIQSLRKIKNTVNGNVEINVPNNTGIEQTNVVIPFNVHYGSGEITPNYFDVFMGGLCNKDFSDVRFTDNSDNLLDIHKHSQGNYEFLVDTKLKSEMWVTSTGKIVGCETFVSGGVFISDDNATSWVQILPANSFMIGLTPVDDVLYYKNGEQGVYKCYANTNYTTSTKVLTPAISEIAIWRSIATDDLGYIYLGQYQIEFGAKMYKSVDNGENWTLAFSDNNHQHVHRIILNKETIPNVIYLDVDGSVGGGIASPACYKSLDRGVTWAQLPYESDDVVLYAENAYRIGGGEGARKPYPTISRTIDDVNFTTQLDVAQHLVNMYKQGSDLFAIGLALDSHPYSKIYRSSDNGITWTSVIDSEQIIGSNNAAGYRYGSLYPVNIEGQEQQALLAAGPTYATLLPMRGFVGGDHYQALIYVKIPVLPSDGLTIKCAYGYMAEDVKGDVLENFDVGSKLAVGLGLNEVSTDIYDSNGILHAISNNSLWKVEKTIRKAWLVPFENTPISAAVNFYKDDSVILQGLTFNKNFTVNFWFKLAPLTQTGGETFLFGRLGSSGNQLLFKRLAGLLKINYGGTEVSLNIFNSKQERNYVMYTVTITNDTVPKMIAYWNGARVSDPEVELTGFNDSMIAGDWYVGGLKGTEYGVTINEQGYFANLNIYDQELTDAEVRELYEGGNILR